jgi:hypothetical protein
MLESMKLRRFAAALLVVVALGAQTSKHWSGSGIKETESFDIRSKEWSITWQTTKERFRGASIFQIYVYDDSQRLVSIAANKQGEGQDTSYVHAGPGRYWLKINSGNVNWAIVVEDR